MINTLLFDLDGTLLPIDTDEFIDNYLKLLASKLDSIIEPKDFIHNLMSSTYTMIHDLNPAKTNKEVFWEDFLPRMPSDKKEDLVRIFDEFYNNDFPALSRIVNKNPVAAKILNSALMKGYNLVIATSPIFPETAILERLKWIDALDFPYKLVTTYENMHFSKPHPEYYEEILDKIQKRPDECMMIGNDAEEDLAAGLLGIRTYLVTDYLLNRKNLEIKCDHCGSLNDLLDFIDKLKEA
ncbi:MAG: HAD family hydrolase [Tepidanaerobacteraceae bacterium]|jgi:FMN phosphatase YigB (HAD superfamily)|nr:HAD family hydrolase [Tepidanaerobacteraceae bacterium]